MKPQGFFFVPPLAFLFFLAGPLPGFGQNDRQSIAEEIRALTESGIPSLMERALDQIQQRNLGTGEFGRIMSAVNVNLFRRVYPGINARFPSPDPPQSHNYARILRDVEQGVYTSPPGNSLDYLEFVLPFLALLDETREDRLLPALPDLRRAAVLNSGSVLAPLFIGMVHERTGNSGEAERAYRRALGLSAECYPAGLALARLKIQAGDLDGAIRDLQEMVRNFSDNSAVKQQLAVAYYRRGDWAQAETAIVEILRQDSRDGELLLMLAHALVEQGRFLSAQRPLELYAAVSGRNPFYHFLQARILEEGMGNREGAINSLRALVHSGAASGEALIYAVRLFLESPRSEDLEEGRALLKGLLEGNPGADVIRLAVRDNIKAGNWEAARDYLSPLLNDPRDGDLLSAYTIEQGLGNNAAALSYARDLYERNPDNDEGVAAYISALIETGRQAEAGRLIESRLAAGLTDSQKSPYYYLRSRIRSGDDQVVADLRASLFADPRNLSSLIAMFEFYHFRRPEKARALIYLRQALAQDPSNPQLRRYAAEYPEILMN
ncbi:MAG: tetratricopeptide repeat protein [Treponema sp.]|nr:tetratricopeptide repeat protein [Treponema sp.]